MNFVLDYNYLLLGMILCSFSVDNCICYEIMFVYIFIIIV